MVVSRRLWEQLAERALSARERAYAPYSGFSVGAALLVADDTNEPRIITGCNVENASYGLALCAERTAIARAVAEGFRRFAAMAVASGSDEPAAPCGMCRQVLVEFCDDDLPILLLNDTGKQRKTRLRQLLPQPFRGQQLR